MAAPDRPAASPSRAVVERRATPPDALDYFPTPPWATRAFLAALDAAGLVWAHDVSAWEPACGEGHMAEVLRERFPLVRASDVHDYGRGYEVGSFVGAGLDVARGYPDWFGRCDWIITNPPFTLAVEFAERAIDEADAGVALLVRMSWLEGGDRFRRLFDKRPPAAVFVHCDRVPMVAGRWDPDASTATSYCWVVWRGAHFARHPTRLLWIPPGARERFTRADDVARFARPAFADRGAA